MKFPKVKKEMTTKEKIVYIIKKFPDLNQTELMKKLGMKISRPAVSQALSEIELEGKIKINGRVNKRRYYIPKKH